MMTGPQESEWPIRLHDGHVYMTIMGCQWILDTGAPVSFGDTPWHPLDVSAPLPPRTELANGGWSDARSVSKHLGVKVAGVIGCDFLNRHEVCIDLPKGVFKFLNGGIPQGHTHVLGFPAALRGIPTIKATIAGECGEYIFDTGAQLSYYVGDPPPGHTPTPDFPDFWPGVDNFVTPTFTVDVTFTNYAMPIKFGQPVDGLKATLLQANLKGIIGIDLIRQSSCCYYPRRKLMVIE